MSEVFFDFLKDPSRDSFLVIRQFIIDSEAYAPYSDELFTAEELLEKGDFAAARDCLHATMPNLLLSGSAHMLLASATRKLGDEKRADFENYVALACIDGILSTGDGSRERPYLVLRTSDEYDVLLSQEKEPEMQSLVHDGDRVLDSQQCSDGSILWFDITAAYRRLEPS